MTGFGLIIAVCVYTATDSIGRALVGLLIAGVVGNMLPGPVARNRRL
ncbi:MAG TPA: hypothetical protein VNF71_12785 [Acidimicrobiales bacterium]|nr:hypothetical protein [Acidimicrobiales bacterium]